MNRLMPLRLVRPAALALLGSLAACTLSEHKPRAVSDGTPAPAYDAVTLAGDSTSIEALKGDVVLLNIWATWCHPCRAEIPVLERLHDEYSSAGLRVVGVSVDARGEQERVGAFAESLGMTYQVWHDPMIVSRRCIGPSAFRRPTSSIGGACCDGGSGPDRGERHRAGASARCSARCR